MMPLPILIIIIREERFRFLFLMMVLREYLGCHPRFLVDSDDRLLVCFVIVIWVTVILMVMVSMMMWRYRGLWNEYTMEMDLKYFLLQQYFIIAVCR